MKRLRKWISDINFRDVRRTVRFRCADWEKRIMSSRKVGVIEYGVYR